MHTQMSAPPYAHKHAPGRDSRMGHIHKLIDTDDACNINNSDIKKWAAHGPGCHDNTAILNTALLDSSV